MAKTVFSRNDFLATLRNRKAADASRRKVPPIDLKDRSPPLPCPLGTGRLQGTRTRRLACAISLAAEPIHRLASVVFQFQRKGTRLYSFLLSCGLVALHPISPEAMIRASASQAGV